DRDPGDRQPDLPGQADHRVRLPGLRRYPRLLVPHARQRPGRGPLAHGRRVRGPVPRVPLRGLGREPRLQAEAADAAADAEDDLDLPGRLGRLHDPAQPPLGALHLVLRLTQPTGASAGARTTSMSPLAVRTWTVRSGASPTGAASAIARSVRVWPDTVTRSR